MSTKAFLTLESHLYPGSFYSIELLRSGANKQVLRLYVYAALERSTTKSINSFLAAFATMRSTNRSSNYSSSSASYKKAGTTAAMTGILLLALLSPSVCDAMSHKQPEIESLQDRWPRSLPNANQEEESFDSSFFNNISSEIDSNSKSIFGQKEKPIVVSRVLPSSSPLRCASFSFRSIPKNRLTNNFIRSGVSFLVSFLKLCVCVCVCLSVTNDDLRTSYWCCIDSVTTQRYPTQSNESSFVHSLDSRTL